MKVKNKLMTLEQFKQQHYGKRGTVKRDKLERGYITFKLSAMIALGTQKIMSRL